MEYVRIPLYKMVPLSNGSHAIVRAMEGYTGNMKQRIHGEVLEIQRGYLRIETDEGEEIIGVPKRSLKKQTHGKSRFVIGDRVRVEMVQSGDRHWVVGIAKKQYEKKR